MDITQSVALALGVSWASGLNLYAAILTLGLMGVTGNADLPPSLVWTESPIVILAAGFMYCVEFFADKIPAVDSGWDAIHTFIRIPAGAIMASAAVANVSPEWQTAAMIVGGGVAASTHLTKSGSRVLINTSPEPVTNWLASFTEDFAVVGTVWAALVHPWVSVAIVLASLLLIIWLLPKLWRGIKLVFQKLASFFGGKPAAPPAQ
ncbi:MAG: DUF4126 domain-containing protein [bacterium]